MLDLPQRSLGNMKCGSRGWSKTQVTEAADRELAQGRLRVVRKQMGKVRRQEWAGCSAGTVAQALGWRPEEWEG